MRIRIDDQDYRLYFRYRYERPVWGAATGRRHDIRSASWELVLPDQIRDRKDLKFGDLMGDQDVFVRQELYRTTEAVLEKLLPEVDSSGRPVGVEIATGISRCSPLDRYERSEGIRKAFDKLKAAVPFTGLQKKQLFEAFRDRGPSELEALKQHRDKIDARIQKLLANSDNNYRTGSVTPEAAKNESVAIGKRKELGI